jgi:hypothetical protein
MCEQIGGPEFRITEIGMDGMGLNGTIPGELFSITWLKELRLNDNHFAGTIPELCTYGCTDQLGVLHLSRNNLEGRLPTDLGELGTLKDFGVADNQLTGVLPDDLPYRQWQHACHMGGNNFSCPLPADLGDYCHPTCS